MIICTSCCCDPSPIFFFFFLSLIFHLTRLEACSAAAQHEFNIFILFCVALCPSHPSWCRKAPPLRDAAAPPFRVGTASFLVHAQRLKFSRSGRKSLQSAGKQLSAVSPPLKPSLSLFYPFSLLSFSRHLRHYSTPWKRWLPFVLMPQLSNGSLSASVHP